MIKFLKPYFDEKEEKIIRGEVSIDLEARESLMKDLAVFFPGGDFMTTDSGSQAIEMALKLSLHSHEAQGKIAIPSAICGNVYNAVKDHGKLTLMDADETWNCVYDTEALASDFLLFADLGGKRKELPENTSAIVLEDAAQCYDGMAGFRDTDFSIFSFGLGKQMFANGGGILYSKKHDLSEVKTQLKPTQIVRLYLMLSQLYKSTQINVLRKEYGLYLIEKLKDLDWIKLPDPKDHVFSKFTVFIRQSDPLLLVDLKRTKEILSFMRHMLNNGVEVEETYIPLHVRFPNEFTDGRYDDFTVNKLWMEAITLPCRPNLTEEELEQIVGAVRTYVPLTDRDVRRNVPELIDRKYMEYYEKYPMENMLTKGTGYFGELHDIKVNLVEQYANSKAKILDVGCGPGLFTLELLEKGYQVDGLDVVDKYLAKLTERLKGKSFNYNPRTILASVSDMSVIEDNSYDLVFSFSTLYHVKDQIGALNEIYRIMKVYGTAVLEFGNINSLNYIATNRHESTKDTPSYYFSLEEIEKRIWDAGFDIVQHRCFQIFPYWNGHVYDSIITGITKGEFVKKNKGMMLDERISSTISVMKYAFRHIFVLGKSTVRQGLPSKMSDAFQKMEWVKPERMKRRKEAVDKTKNSDDKTWAGGIADLLDILEDDPSDLMTIYELMMLHKYDEYRDFAETLKKDFPDKKPRMGDVFSTLTTGDDLRQHAKVSVVVPVYNQAHWLPDILDSLRRQTFRDFEVIVVNDGSTDETAQWLDDNMQFGFLSEEGYSESSMPRFRHIDQENMKLPGALNTGFRHARGKYLTWVSSDCYCAPYMLEALKNALDKFPEAGMAYGDFMLMDEHGHLLNRISNPSYNRRSLLVRNDGNAAFMYRREVAEKVGEYDENLNGAEDWDYWIRISKNWPFVYVPEILYYYRLHGTSMQQSIPNEVNESIIKMMTKVFNKMKQLRMEELYPELPNCTDQHNAMYAAAFDFGSSLLNARVLMPELSIMFLKKATEINPSIVFGWINLAIAYAKQGRWTDATAAISRTEGKIKETNIQAYVDQLTQNIVLQSKSNIARLPIVNFNRRGVELFEKENSERMICPFTISQEQPS